MNKPEMEGGHTMNYNLPEIRRTTYAKKSGDERRCKTCVLMAHEVTPRDIWAAFTDRKYRCTIAGMRTGATGTCALYTSLEMVKEQNGRGVK